MPNAPRCSLIIPQHEQPELTVMAVRSWRQHHAADHQVVIVDDGSHRQSLQKLRHGLADIACRTTMLRLSCRQGVTAAWNAGADQAREDLLIFLNNDTLTRGPWLDQLTHPIFAGVAEMTGPQWREEPDFPGILKRCSQQSLLLEGWCLALRKETFRRLRGFDPRLQLYFSDTDLQCRLLQHTRSLQPLCAVDQLPLEHLAHRTTRQLSTRGSQWQLDRRRFQRKWKLMPLPALTTDS